MRIFLRCVLTATLMASVAALLPIAASAQQQPGSLHCCCDVDYASCVDSPLGQGRLNSNRGFCPPDGDTTHTEYCQSGVGPGTPSSCPRQDPGLHSCSIFVNPQGADAATAAEEEARTRSWIFAILGDELIPEDCRTGDAKGCTLNHLLQVLVNVTRVMLAVLGSAAFAMFIYGGVVFLTSMGNQERVTTGRRILANAVLGILVVLVSWTAVNFVVVALSQGRGGFGQVGQIFSNSWNRGP